MKLVTLEKLYRCLRDEQPVVTVDPAIAKRAILPINKMLEISAQLGL
jgi:quinolinate synthase